ncbi:MAG TPA: hypothetical protein VFM37_11495, partial [Pseudonocardiaceae bacterium]|nr:hypothetical protein [Pseudonocardiaceae bacterium]
MQSTFAILTIGDLPAHPLIVHGAVVLLPLAALGALLMALMPSLRRRLGVAVLLLAAAGVGAVPLATRTGDELKAALPPNNPLIEAHKQRGDELLPYALAFGIAVVLLVIAGRLADRERSAAHPSTEQPSTEQPSTGQPRTGQLNTGQLNTGGDDARASAAPRTWRRIALVAAALVAFSAVTVTVQVVRV